MRRRALPFSTFKGNRNALTKINYQRISEQQNKLSNRWKEVVVRSGIVTWTNVIAMLNVIGGFLNFKGKFLKNLLKLEMLYLVRWFTFLWVFMKT